MRELKVTFIVNFEHANILPLALEHVLGCYESYMGEYQSEKFIQL